MLRNLVLAAALICAALAPAGPASAQSNSVPNGAYYGVYFPTTTIVAMAVRNNDVGATTIFTQNFNYPFTSGLPQSFFPGVTNLTLANPGTAGKISSSGSWVLPNDSFGDFFQPDLCGQTRKGYMVASMTCSPNGITPGTNAMFSLRPTTLNIAPGTYTGSVNSTPRDPALGSNPSTPWTGTTGSVTLNVGGGTISGSASLSPVNPQTGFPEAGPPVTVTYAPVSISSSASVPTTGGASTATGLFNVPSSPDGYSLCGGFLINGLVIGVSPCGTQNVGTSTGSYIASTFELSNSSS
jgi:hypothetical protein